MAKRVTVRILSLYGNEAKFVPDSAAEHTEPFLYPAGMIAAEAGVPVWELPGKRLTVEVVSDVNGLNGYLSGWRPA